MRVVRTFFTDNIQVSGEHSSQRPQVLRHEKHHGRLHDRSAERAAHLCGRQHAEAEEPDVAKQKTKDETASRLSCEGSDRHHTDLGCGNSGCG